MYGGCPVIVNKLVELGLHIKLEKCSLQSESILILLRFPVVYRDDVMPAPGGEATQHQGAVHGDPIQALGEDKATTEADGTSSADVPCQVDRVLKAANG